MKSIVATALLLSLTSLTLLDNAEGWRYEQKIRPPKRFLGDQEYGAFLSDIVAFANGTALFAASTKNSKAYVIRNGNSYHKWKQNEYMVFSDTNTEMFTDSVALTDKVLFIGLLSEDKKKGIIQYFWLGENGEIINSTYIGQRLSIPYIPEPITENRIYRRFFAISRDSINAAAYFTAKIFGVEMGIVYYWTRDAMRYRYSGKYVFDKTVSSEKVMFMDYINSHIVLGIHNNDTDTDEILVVNNGRMQKFQIDCPKGTVIGDASPYDDGSLLAISCVCPYRKDTTAQRNEESDVCVAAVLVYKVTSDNCTLVSKVNNSGYTDSRNNFGKSISFYNDILVVSAPYYDEVRIGDDESSSAGGGGEFKNSENKYVDDDEDDFRPSLEYDCGNEKTSEGRAYVYLYWKFKLQKMIVADSKEAMRGFGTSVAVMGDLLAVSAPYEKNSPGKIYLFSVNQFSAGVIGIILFGFLIISIFIILSVLTYYKLHPMSVTAVQPEFK